MKRANPWLFFNRCRSGQWDYNRRAFDERINRSIHSAEYGGIKYAYQRVTHQNLCASYDPDL